MYDDDLTAFQSSQLEFLKQQVDRFQEERWKEGNPNAENDLFAAREELTRFVTDLTWRPTTYLRRTWVMPFIL